MFEFLVSQILWKLLIEMSSNKSININQELNGELQIDSALLEAQLEVDLEQNRLDFNTVSSDLREKLLNVYLLSQILIWRNINNL